MWRELIIADVAAPMKNALVGGPFGSNLVSRDYTPSGVPVIRGQNMGFGRWVGGEFVFVSEDKAEELSANIARPGDLLFTQRGTLGQVAIVPPASFDRYIISQSQMKLTVDSSKADAKFLYYFFASREQQEYIRQNAIQTGVPHTNLGHLRNTPVQLPPLPEQRAIASVLGSLDDKIELNRRMNETLESLAQSLFKSWFLDATQSALPKGWKVMKFGEFIERLSVGEKYDQKSASPSGKIPILDQGKSGVIGFHNNEPGVVASFEKPVVVFANHTCYMRLITFPFSAIQNVLPFVGAGVDTLWAYYATRGRLAFSEYKGHWPDFVIQDAAVPPEAMTKQFGELVKPLVSCIQRNEEESRTLAALRDALLPKLLSGELRVPAAKLMEVTA